MTYGRRKKQCVPCTQKKLTHKQCSDVCIHAASYAYAQCVSRITISHKPILTLCTVISCPIYKADAYHVCYMCITSITLSDIWHNTTDGDALLNGVRYTWYALCTNTHASMHAQACPIIASSLYYPQGSRCDTPYRWQRRHHRQ